MLMKYDLEFSQQAVKNNLKRLINQVYKLLPMRQQGNDWQKPLQTIIEQLVGLKRLFLGQQEQSFLTVISKLEGMFELTESMDFNSYRRTVFECLNLLGEVKSHV